LTAGSSHHHVETYVDVWRPQMCNTPAGVKASSSHHIPGLCREFVHFLFIPT
jgi:predicted class III extradiol MEMO1 family dioxygenase